MSEYTHCGHGALYTDDCAACDKVGADNVQLPCARRTVAKLLRLYSKESLIELIFAQDLTESRYQENSRLHAGNLLAAFRDFIPTSPCAAEVHAKVNPQKAVKNLGDDVVQIARYIYQCQSDYVGADHEGYCVEIIAQALTAIKDQP